MKKIVIMFLLLGGLASCGTTVTEEPVVETIAPLPTLIASANTQIQGEILSKLASLCQDKGFQLEIREDSKGENTFGEEGALIYRNPMGIYSATAVELEEPEDGTLVALPVENQSEALLLLEEQGLISLSGAMPFTLDSLEGNYFNLEFLETEEGYSLLDEVEFVILSAETAWMSGLNAPFAVGRGGEVYFHGDTVLTELLQGAEMQNYIQDSYQGRLLSGVE